MIDPWDLYMAAATTMIMNTYTVLGPREIAKLAAEIADEMMKERNKRNDSD